MAQAPLRKPLHKRWTVWLLVILALYTLLGFQVLPWWLERALPQQLEQRLGWSASVEEVTANPYAMSVTVRGLDASDGQEPVLRLQRLHLDLGFLQLFRGLVALETIDLDQPYLRVDLLEDYGINLLRDWRAHNPRPEGEPQPAQSGSEGEPARLYFGRISLNQGEVLLRDFSKAEEASFEIRSLDLVLNDLATFPNENGSGYRFNATLGEQSLAWEGQLNLVPFSSSGRLRLENLAATTIGHFAAPYLPYELRQGRLTVASDYRTNTRDGLTLETSNGRIEISDLAVATGSEEGDTPDLALAALVADSIGFSLSRRELGVGEVSLQGLDARVQRAGDGSLNLLRPFADDDQTGETGKADGEPDTGADQPFRWSVARVGLEQSRVQWQDAVPEQAISLDLSEIQLNVEGLSHELAEPVRYDASLVAAGGRLSGSGQLTLSPFTLEAGVSAQALSLAAAEGYLKELAALDVKAGQLTLDGDLDLDGQTEPLTGTFSGRGELTGVALARTGEDRNLVSWQSVRLEPIEYNLAPARLEIGSIALASPEVRLERSQSGALNLIEVLAGDDPDDPQGADSDRGGEDGDGFIFRVGEVVLQQGTVNYTDRSLERRFATRLHQLSGSMTGLSNVTPQKGRVNLSGRVAEAGDLTVEGNLAALGSDQTSTLDVDLDQLSLPLLSPYFARYLGYTVDGGKLALALDYRLEGTQLSGTNHIVLDRLELGQSVASEQAVDAPIKLGLALLRGSGGQIELDIPIDGDLEDPNFQIGGVVLGAFANLVIKAATSPFSVLGSIADLTGLTGPELSAIGFRPGSAELGEGEARKLEALSQALNQRPGLVLDIRGAVAPVLDGPELAAQGGALEEALDQLAADRGETLQRQLTETYDVDSSQLYLRDPIRDAGLGEDAELVRVPVALQAR